MAGSTGSIPLPDLLKSMTADSLVATSLEPGEVMLVRIAALAAVDAPTASYAFNIEAAGAVGVDAERVRGVLAAIAPIVGTARVVSATARIVEALAIEIELALEEAEAEAEAQ
jgi:alkylhydroperoxidase/carboxymuconolactone decarboxylase family protein YurZ